MYKLDIKISNRLQMLVALMTFSQLMYDVSLIFATECDLRNKGNLANTIICNTTYQGFSKFCNFSVVGYCTVLSVSVLFVANFKRPLFNSLRLVMMCVFVPSFVFGLLTGYYRYQSVRG